MVCFFVRSPRYNIRNNIQLVFLSKCLCALLILDPIHLMIIWFDYLIILIWYFIALLWSYNDIQLLFDLYKMN